MKNLKSFMLFVLSSLVFVNCGGGVGDSPPPPSDSTPPVVSAGDESPTDGSTVDDFCWISATFDEPIAPSTVNETNFVIVHSVNGTLDSTHGSWIISPYSSAQIMFDPSPSYRPIPTGTITATVTTGITDTSGNSLAANYPWTFHTTGTGGLPPCPAPFD